MQGLGLKVWGKGFRVFGSGALGPSPSKRSPAGGDRSQVADPNANDGPSPADVGSRAFRLRA